MTRTPMAGETENKRDVLFYIKGTSNKLKPDIIPIISRNYSYLSDGDIENLWDFSFRSVYSWLRMMEKNVIPKRQELLDIEIEEGQLTVVVPDIIPELKFGEIPVEVYRKLKRALEFYLNLYDIVKKQEHNWEWK